MDIDDIVSESFMRGYSAEDWARIGNGRSYKAIGEADRIAPVQGSQVLFERLGSQDKQLMVYPGLRHEVHNEKAADRARFLDLLSGWILQRARR